MSTADTASDKGTGKVHRPREQGASDYRKKVNYSSHLALPVCRMLSLCTCRLFLWVWGKLSARIFYTFLTVCTGMVSKSKIHLVPNFKCSLEHRLPWEEASYSHSEFSRRSLNRERESWMRRWVLLASRSHSEVRLWSVIIATDFQMKNWLISYRKTSKILVTSHPL